MLKARLAASSSITSEKFISLGEHSQTKRLSLSREVNQSVFSAKMKSATPVMVVLLKTTCILLAVLLGLSFFIALCWIIYGICRRRGYGTEEITTMKLTNVRRSKRERNGAVPDMVKLSGILRHFAALRGMGGIPGTWRIKESSSSTKTQTTDCEMNQKYDENVQRNE